MKRLLILCGALSTAMMGILLYFIMASRNDTIRASQDEGDSVGANALAVRGTSQRKSALDLKSSISLSRPAELDEKELAEDRDRELAGEFVKFRDQVRENSWAAKTEKLLTIDLARLNLKNIVKSSIECRSTMCKVDLTWSKSNEIDIGIFNSIAHHSYAVNCPTLTVPGVRSSPFLGRGLDSGFSISVLFDCASWRGAGSVALEQIP